MIILHIVIGRRITKMPTECATTITTCGYEPAFGIIYLSYQPGALILYRMGSSHGVIRIPYPVEAACTDHSSAVEQRRAPLPSRSSIRSMFSHNSQTRRNGPADNALLFDDTFQAPSKMIDTDKNGLKEHRFSNKTFGKKYKSDHIDHLPNFYCIDF